MSQVLAILSILGGRPGVIELCERRGRLYFVACHRPITAIVCFLVTLAVPSIAWGCEPVERLYLTK